MRVGDYDLIPPEVTAAAIYIMRNPFRSGPVLRAASGLRSRYRDRPDDESGLDGGHRRAGIFEPLGRWDDHVNSWTTAPGLPRHVLRYEDMLANTGKAMRGLIEKFFRMPVDKPKLARAVKATNFESMKKFEEKHGLRKSRPR